jgi:hypothetical protein
MLTFTLSPADFFIFWKLCQESKIQAIRWIRDHQNLPHLTLLSSKRFVEEMVAHFQGAESFDELSDLSMTFTSDLRFWHGQDVHKFDNEFLAAINRILAEEMSPNVRALSVQSAANNHRVQMKQLNKS